MNKPFKRVILWSKRHRATTVITTLRQLITHLKKWQITVMAEKETAKMLPRNLITAVAENQLKTHGDLIIVIGGDGSLLSAARCATTQQLPVLGINRGKLGFLTDIRPQALNQIKAILQGKYCEESRFLLKADVQSARKIIATQIGLNDIVLVPGEIAQMIEFSIYINGEFVCVQRADGLIIATPTGSTAYALSGGGPILHPNLNAIVLVPMFPHTLTSRPIVVSADSTIEIHIAAHNQITPRLSGDGQPPISVTPGQIIRVQKMSSTLQLIHPLHYRYFDTLRDKLHWENKPIK